MNHRLRIQGINWDGDYDRPIEEPFGEWVPRKGLRELIKLLRKEGTHIWGGHAGDEFGNCTLYFRCLFFGVTWWYPTGHYQTDVELPEPGVNTWVDKTYYDE